MASSLAIVASSSVMPVPRGNCIPVGVTGQRAAVVVVAEVPVRRVQAVFVEAGDGPQLRPCGWVGRPGKHHAIVEQDRIDVGRGVPRLDCGII